MKHVLTFLASLLCCIITRAQCTTTYLGLDPVTQPASIWALDLGAGEMNVVMRPAVPGVHSRSIIVSRTDGSGTPIWQRRIRHTNPDFTIYPQGIIVTQDRGSFIYGSLTHGQGFQYGDGPRYVNEFAMRLDSMGLVQWARIYMIPTGLPPGIYNTGMDGSRSEYKNGARELADGTFNWIHYFSGTTVRVTLDSAGIPLSANEYHPLTDGGLTGRAMLGPDGSMYGTCIIDQQWWGTNTALYKLTPAGQLEWATYLERAYSPETGSWGAPYESAIELADNGDIVVGTYHESGDAIFRVSPTGQFLWHKEFSQQTNLKGLAVLPGGDILFGITYQHKLLRLSSDGSSFVSALTNGANVSEIWSRPGALVVATGNSLTLAPDASQISSSCGFNPIALPAMNNIVGSDSAIGLAIDTSMIKTWLLALDDTSSVALDLLAGGSISRLVPGQGLNIIGSAVNLSTTSCGALTVTCTLPSEIGILSVTPTPTSTVGNVVTWDVPAGLPAEGWWNFSISGDLPPDASMIGTTLSGTVVVSQAAPETDLSNNTITFSRTVVGPYDPNVKLASTSSGINDSIYFTGTDRWLDYTICFQNTGSAAAQNIIVTDTLPAELRVGGFVQLGSSHPCAYELGGNGVLRFIFNNINLPDSTTNEPGSHGAVSFRIRPETGLAPATLIANHADILFDLNPAVRTADNHVWIDMSTSVPEAHAPQLKVYPDPVHDRLNVLLPADMPVRAVRVLTMDGRCVKSERSVMGQGPLTVDVRSLPPQVYLLAVEGVDGKRLTTRFVKE